MTPKHLTGGHWYAVTGEPKHFVEKKDGSGLRSTTLADARKNNWLPSVTTIEKILAKPQLEAWKIDNALNAAITTPRIAGETDDEFKARVLAVDSESISDAAKQLGTDVHDAIEAALGGTPIDKIRPELVPFVLPAVEAVNKFGRVIMSEKSLVGQGYAGRVDCVTEGELITVIDFKTSGAKALPEKSYDEHRRQLAAYGKALGVTGDKRIQTANIYISTVRAGEIAVCINEDWQADYEVFRLVLKLWQTINNYKPEQ